MNIQTHYMGCKYQRKFYYSVILILHPTSSITILSYCLFNCDLLSHCSSVPQSSIPSSIFSLQTNLQLNSHPILISPLLQCSFPQPLARVDRCRERIGRRQSQLDTTVPLVSLNLSKVLCQAFPVHSCIPFSSLKVAQKEWGPQMEGQERREYRQGQNKKKKQYNLFEMCQKWKMEKTSSDEILCAPVFSNSPQY